MAKTLTKIKMTNAKKKKLMQNINKKYYIKHWNWASNIHNIYFQWFY